MKYPLLDNGLQSCSLSHEILRWRTGCVWEKMVLMKFEPCVPNQLRKILVCFLQFDLSDSSILKVPLRENVC